VDRLCHRHGIGSVREIIQGNSSHFLLKKLIAFQTILLQVLHEKHHIIYKLGITSWLDYV